MIAHLPAPKGCSHSRHIPVTGGDVVIGTFPEVNADEIDVGREMRMVFRIKAQDEMRHFTRYFWKATPA